MVAPEIEVVPATPAALEELLASIAGHDDMFPDVIERTIAALRDGADTKWGTHVFVDRATGRVVGYGGYTGPPRDGTVEIGYSVLPKARGRGVATAAARALAEEARARGCNRCIAHTLPEHNASTSVLEHCGFVRDGEATDPDEGPVWRWSLTLG